MEQELIQTEAGILFQVGHSLLLSGTRITKWDNFIIIWWNGFQRAQHVSESNIFKKAHEM